MCVGMLKNWKSLLSMVLNSRHVHHQRWETPSDVNGVIYLAVDRHGAWKMLLARELKAAGVESISIGPFRGARLWLRKQAYTQGTSFPCSYYRYREKDSLRGA